MTKLAENLRIDDLKYCVSNFISVDEYVSKIDDDNITIAFFCNDRDVAEELKDFIEKAFFTEIKDIEIANTITEDNKYILFVEFERKISFPKILLNVLQDISFLTNEKKWSFTTLNHHKQLPCNEENLRNYVRLTKLKDAPKEVKENKELVLSNGYDKIKFINEGYVSSKVMENHIRKSSSLNDIDERILKLLENKFPNSSIISTDEKVFVIRDNKILMLG